MRGLKLWWRAVRPFAYPASIMPALVGIAAAWSDGFKINYINAFLVVLGVVLAHTGGNLINDYFDYKRGVDRPGQLGGSGILVNKILSPRSFLVAAAISLFIAGAIGVYFCLAVNSSIAWLMLLGFIAAVFYVAPPLGLKYRAAGDLTVFFSFGVGTTLGAYMVQSYTFSWTPIFYSVCVGLLVVAILHVNNLRDLGDDTEIGVRTLASYLGARGSKIMYAAVVLGAYVLTLLFYFLKIFPVGTLAVFLTLPIALKIISGILKAKEPLRETLAGFDAKTAQLNLAFGIAMIVGIVIS